MWRCVIARSTSRGFFLAAALVLGGCQTTVSGNTLLGNWRIDLPTLPHSHGNEIGFREGCLIVGGNRVDTQVMSPAAYVGHGRDTFVWFGPAAGADNLRTADAAQVQFLTPDRIRIVWPEGIEARYMRAIDLRVSERDCG